MDKMQRTENYKNIEPQILYFLYYQLHQLLLPNSITLSRDNIGFQLFELEAQREQTFFVFPL